MATRPPTAEEVPEDKRGGLGLEVYKDESWVDVTDKSEMSSLIHLDEGNESDEVNETEMDVDYEAEEEAVDDPVRILTSLHIPACVITPTHYVSYHGILCTVYVLLCSTKSHLYRCKPILINSALFLILSQVSH